MNESADKLNRFLAEQPPLAIAVSGGVDSLTLAWSAHLQCPNTTIMVHAVSPAVPPEATKLVQDYAKKGGWDLQVINAHEYDDPRYRNNPIDRCFYCKTNLYARIKQVTGLTIASGTNTDDLGDYRPGLKAAEEHQVIHPYVEVGIDKQTVRQIASSYGLDKVAKLPAQPCLASRVETGISIDANDLHFINSVESLLRLKLGNGDIRCRLTSSGVKVEISKNLLNTEFSDNEKHRVEIEQQVKALCVEQNRRFLGIKAYEKGSAFIHPVLS